MRILFISPFMHRYRRGIERFTVDLASELVRNGDEVHILAWRDPQQLKWQTAHPAIQWHQLPLTRFYQRLCAGWLYPIYVRRIQPDVLILSFLWHGEEIALRFIDRSIQRILVLNYPAAQVTSRYEYLQNHQALKQIDKFVAVSQYVADGAAPYIGAIDAIIPNGVYTDSFRPNPDKQTARKSLDLPQDADIIVSVAALEWRKGVQHVIAAMPSVLSQRPTTHYVVAGEGSARDALQDEIEKLSLQDNVHLLGNVEDVRLVYDSADLFAFLTTGEACPIALLEAMASGLPLLLATQPPLNEFADEDGAVFVDMNDSIHVAQSIIRLLEDREKRTEMGQNNREAAEQYDWSHISQQYLALFP